MPRNLTAPAAVRAALRRGLQLVRDGHAGRGLRGETVRWAERLADGDPITRDKAVRMRAWFARHGVARAESARRLRDPTAPSSVAWLTWGGTPSIPYRVTGWRDPVAAWLRDVLATFDRPRPARRAVRNGRSERYGAIVRFDDAETKRNVLARLRRMGASLREVGDGTFVAESNDSADVVLELAMSVDGLWAKRVPLDD